MRKDDIHQLESIEQFVEYAYAQGWTDGLPAEKIQSKYSRQAQ